MSYQISRDNDDGIIRITRDGQLAYELAREDDGRGIWALYRLRDGLRGPKIDRDQYANDLIERVTSELILQGAVADHPEGRIVAVPANTSDFYLARTGYLMCRRPVRLVLSAEPVAPDNVSYRGVRPASIAELEQAGGPFASVRNAVVVLQR